jgi:methanol metabolism-related c-type cytochrome
MIRRRAPWKWLPLSLLFAVALGTPVVSEAQDEEKPYNIKDGVVDWATYSGYRRYHGTCHTCHGPDGLGSTFAPALLDPVKEMSLDQFMEVVVNGRQNVAQGQKVMPAFGTDPNVMCFVEDIYTYLKARADGALDRGRPAEHESKPPEATEHEDACLG